MTELFGEGFDCHVDQLPPLPTTVVEILRIVGEGEVDMRVVADKICRDTALAARVIRVANSPFYGLNGEIYSVRDATFVLGTATIRNIVIAAGLMEHLRPTEGGGLDVGELWRHSFGTGIAAKRLGEKCGVEGDMAFTAGLLHDLGSLVLVVHYPDKYASVLSYIDAEGCSITEAETAVLGIDHAEIGARVANHWGFPKDFVDAIRKHHKPDEEGGAPLADVVHAANLISHCMNAGNCDASLVGSIARPVVSRLRLNWQDIENILPEIESGSTAASLLLT